jgi:glycosyltransferase involved in cell wall biosynthesis
MNILHLYKDYDPIIGGIENHIRMLAEAQARRGHRVTVLVTSPTNRTTIRREKGVLVIRASRFAHVASTPLSLSLPLILSRLKRDIAHLHFPYPWGELATLAASHIPRVVVTYHSDIVRQGAILPFYRPFMHRILQRAAAIIATSPPYVESSDVLRHYRDKVRVVPLGVETTLYAHSHPGRVHAVRGEWSPDREPLVLFVGRLRYYKGLDILLQAATRLTRGRVLIVGSGPERRKLDQLCERLRLEERVHFLGDVSDEELLALRHAVRESGGLFVLPATERSEAFGMVLLEALSAGLPLVTTELGTGTSWVNRDGVTGRVVPAGDPAVLASALNDLLARPRLLAEMSAAATARARQFDVEAMVARVEAVYHDVTRDVSTDGKPEESKNWDGVVSDS